MEDTFEDDLLVCDSERFNSSRRSSELKTLQMKKAKLAELVRRFDAYVQDSLERDDRQADYRNCYFINRLKFQMNMTLIEIEKMEKALKRDLG